MLLLGNMEETTIFKSEHLRRIQADFRKAIIKPPDTWVGLEETLYEEPTPTTRRIVFMVPSLSYSVLNKVAVMRHKRPPNEKWVFRLISIDLCLNGKPFATRKFSPEQMFPFLWEIILPFRGYIRLQKVTFVLNLERNPDVSEEEYQEKIFSTDDSCWFVSVDGVGTEDSRWADTGDGIIRSDGWSA